MKLRGCGGFEAGCQGVGAAVGGEVEFFALVDDEQGGAGELLFLEAVLEFLKQGGIGLEAGGDGFAQWAERNLLFAGGVIGGSRIGERGGLVPVTALARMVAPGARAPATIA